MPWGKSTIDDLPDEDQKFVERQMREHPLIRQELLLDQIQQIVSLMRREPDADGRPITFNSNDL